MRPPTRTEDAGGSSSPRGKPSRDAEKPTKQSKRRDELNASAGEDDEDGMASVLDRYMGFSQFKSTKDTKVPGNDKNWAIRREKKIEYRQYMNRTGGFNRPLSPG